MSNFTYRGVNLSDYGILYAPENKDWHIWVDGFRSFEQVIDSQHGGQWYGASVSPKEFELRCYFEDITEYQLSAATTLFSRGAYGNLVFDERPWLIYKARVVKPCAFEKYVSYDGKYSGLVTIYLTAHYPFATTDMVTLEDATQYTTKQSIILGTTGLIPSSQLPANTAPSSIIPRANAFTNLYLNAGDAEAHTIIKIAGDVGKGVTIYNQTNGMYCKVIGITAALTTSVSKWVEINSRTGEVFLTNGTVNDAGWKYHDRSFIDISPSAPIQRDKTITYAAGSTIGMADDFFSDESVGKFIRIGSAWRKITSVNSANSAVVDYTFPGAGSAVTNIVRFNEVSVSPVEGMSLTKFELTSRHTFK